MTKQEYLNLLQEKLEAFSKELQKEIIEDYEEHFAEGLAAGKTEEEIIRELGDIEDMIRELPEDEVSQQSPCKAELAPAAEQGNFVCTGKYQGLVINGLIADVMLERSENETVSGDYEIDEAEGLEPRYCFYQYEKDGVLHLEIKENPDFLKGSLRERKVMLFGKTLVRFNSFRNEAEVRLLVKVPRDIPRIELQTTSGDVRAAGICTVQLSVATTSGDMKLSRNVAEKISARTASGDFEIEEATCREFQLGTASGDVSAVSVTAEELSVKTGSGDVRLSAVKLGSLQAGTGSGDIVETGEIRNRSIRTGSGDVVVNPIGSADSVNIGTGSGDVVLDIQAIDGVRATVRTGSGDGIIHAGDGKHHVSGGESTVGEGSCRVVVTTGSGDAVVKM
ncbi:MAG: DUF4097 family beta strand repeat-containing protein [Roseburia sp.]|nr:DUF4097 family beta strand repeat-containing protein [Roseburia sp.]MCM1097535.1 DUF4097 family beta strand repeat-containing protein [Ruminococcus flavefaciens]